MNILSILQKQNRNYLLIILFLCIPIVVIICLCMGAVPIRMDSLMYILYKKDTSISDTKVILFVRLPRIISAIIAGSSLAVSGSILQTILLNPLASPNIIGVNAGSGLFALLAAILFPSAFILVPLFAFCGALIAGLAVFLLGYKTNASKLTLILSGVAISSLFSAFSDTLITFFPDRQISRTSFMIGRIGIMDYNNLWIIAILTFIGIIISVILSADLNVLALGDETAASLGLNINRLRFTYLALSALLAGCAVSLAGLIGFIGLIIPHITRYIFGNDNRYIIPASAMIGAIFLLICDLLARCLFAPFEIPVGIVLSILGAPFFITLILRGKKVRNNY